ncbi:MmyB family transcriptional regulator [Streptomyces johnsoniae]|uniref:MmyB family transcriptional regulator n=1 Tax=Streptomyces johnsoniae TaxID=3075532 RepID=UPI00374E05AF
MDLVEELSSASAEFRRVRAEQHIINKTHGSYRLAHPRLGSFTLLYRSLRLPEEPDQLLIVYTVDPESPLAAALSSPGTG